MSLSYPHDLKYARSDEWVRIEGDIAVIGISDYAQSELGEVVFIDSLVDVNSEVSADSIIATIESVKAVSEIISPFSGTVTEINDGVRDDPELINGDPYGDGWILKIKLSGTPDLSALMNADEYREYNSER